MPQFARDAATRTRALLGALLTLALAMTLLVVPQPATATAEATPPASSGPAASKPVAPKGVKVTKITYSSATVKWSAVSGATSYKATIYQGKDAVKTKTTSSTSWAVTGLRGETAYTVKIVATNAAGSGPASSAMKFTTKVAPPGKTTVSFANVTQTSATVKFSSARATSYEVAVINRYKTIKSVTVKDRSLKLTGLQADEDYTVTVVAKNSTARADQVRATFSSAPKTPFDLGRLSRDSNSFSVYWWGSVTATSYNVRLWNAETQKLVEEKSTKKQEIGFSALSSGTRYQVRVQAVGPNASSAWSAPFVVTTSPGAPVATVDADRTSSTSAVVQWRPVKGAKSYTVRIENVATKVQDGRSFPADVTEYRWTGLDPATTYSVQVQADDEGILGRSPWSAAVRFTTLKTPLAPPAKAKVTTVTDSSVTFDVPAYPKTGRVRVYLWRASDVTSALDPSTAVRSLETSGGQVELYSLDSDTQYVVGLQGTGGSAGTPDSEIVTTRFRTRLAAPGAPFVRRVTSSSVVLGWDRQGSASSYTVTVRDAKGKAVKRVTTTSPWTTISGLKKQKRYTFELVFATASNTSVPSAPVAVQTAKARKGPAWVKVVGRGKNSATLRWAKVTDATGYVVTVKRKGKVVRTVVTKNASVALKHLRSGTYYSVVVRAKLPDSDTSKASAKVGFTTKAKRSR